MITLKNRTMIQAEKAQGHTTLTIFQVPEGFEPGDRLPDEVLKNREVIIIEKGLVNNLIECLQEVQKEENGVRIAFTHES